MINVKTFSSIHEVNNEYNHTSFDNLIEDNEAYIIKNVLNLEQINFINQKINEGTVHKKYLHNNMGFTLPETIYALDQLDESHLIEYHTDVQKILNDSKEITGIADTYILEILKNVLQCNLLKYPSKKDNNFFAPFSIRYLSPGYGEMSFHCEKDLQKFSTYFYKHTSHQIDNTQVVSYFILINKPVKSGKFTVYDIRNDEIKEKFSNTEFKLANNKRINVEKDLSYINIDLDEGDMFIFNGGDIWHRAEIVEGSEPRITLGGFIAKGLDNDYFYTWS